MGQHRPKIGPRCRKGHIVKNSINPRVFGVGGLGTQRILLRRSRKQQKLCHSAGDTASGAPRPWPDLRASAPCRRPQWSSAQSMDCRGFGIDQRRAKRPLAPQKSHLLDAKSHCQCVSDECFFRPLPLPNSLTLLSETQENFNQSLAKKALPGDCWPPKKSPSGR